MGNIINNNNISSNNTKSKNTKEGKRQKEEESDDEGEEDGDDVDEKEYDFTNKNTVKYPKSERKSEISSIPAPSSLMNKSKK